MITLAITVTDADGRTATYRVEALVDSDGCGVGLRKDGCVAEIGGSRRLSMTWQDADARRDDREIDAPSITIDAESVQ
jgi:hypothetical protein